MTDTPENHPEPEKNAQPNTEPVGYGRPPRGSRWKPTQSGNRKGRRRREDEPGGDLFDRIMKEKIHVYENGKRMRITRCNASARTVVNRGIAGDTVFENILIKIEGPALAARLAHWHWVTAATEDEIPARREEVLASYRERRRRPGRDGSVKRGRPRDDTPFLELVKRELNKTVTIQENGKTMRVTKREAWLRRVATGVIKGDPKCIRTFMKIAKPTEPPPEDNFFYVIGG